MNSEQIFQHKLETIFGDIEQTYQDSTGYYIQINGEWKKLSITSTDQKTTNKIQNMIQEIQSSQK